MQLGLEARRKGEERFLSPRPGAQKPCAGKSRVAPFGMTIGVGDARYPGLTAWAKLCRAYSAQEKEARHGRRPLHGRARGRRAGAACCAATIVIPADRFRIAAMCRCCRCDEDRR